MKKHTAVLFDLDGTLLDTIDDLAESMNSALHRFGLPQHEVEAYKYFVGDGVDILVRRALPEAHRHETMIERSAAAMREEYEKRWAAKTRPYDGIPELLDALTECGVTMAVFSNKPHEFTVKTIATLLPRWRFDRVIGARPSVPKKPAPDGALEIAGQLGIPPQAFLYVGDTNTDMKTAIAAGMYPVGVLWGFRTADELTGAGARTLIAHPLELITLLE